MYISLSKSNCKSNEL